MWQRILTAFLLLVLIASCSMVVRSRARYLHALALLKEVENRSVAFDVVDPEKFNVKLITSEPGRLAWIVYIPRGVSLDSHAAFGTSACWGIPDKPGAPREVVVRWEVRSLPKKDCVMSVNLPTSQVFGGVGDNDSWETILSNWDQVGLELAGKTETEVFENEQVVTLMRYDIPPSLMQRGHSDINERRGFIQIGDASSESWSQAVSDRERQIGRTK